MEGLMEKTIPTQLRGGPRDGRLLDLDVLAKTIWVPSIEGVAVYEVTERRYRTIPGKASGEVVSQWAEYTRTLRST
jgi:hypothetical protein